MNRRFAQCLNKQRKIYNLPYGSLIGASSGLLFGGLVGGMLFAASFGAGGFAFGTWLSDQLFKVGLQRYCYWHLPYASKWIAKNIPDSANRYEL